MMFVFFFSFLFRNVSVSVSDDSGIKPELLCGQRDTFFFLAQKFHIDYKSTRCIESWQGFQAQYLVINESIINGKENNTSTADTYDTCDLMERWVFYTFNVTDIEILI